MDTLISLPERMILESLNRKPKNINELADCTGLQHKIIQNILSVLAAKNLLLTREHKYIINKNINAEILESLKNKENVKIENTFLVKSSLEDENDNAFFIRKVTMSSKERAIYKGLLYNLKSFLSELTHNENDLTKNEEIIFMGEMNYGKSIQHLLHS